MGARRFSFRIGIGQRLARHHLVALGGVVDKDGLDGGDLLQVGRLQPLHDILVGVMGAALVVEIVLDELETGNADRIEAQVIGAAGVAHRDGGDAEVLQRRDPLRKDGRDRRVALEIDAANLARAVVDVEVGRR